LTILIKTKVSLKSIIVLVDPLPFRIFLKNWFTIFIILEISIKTISFLIDELSLGSLVSLDSSTLICVEVSLDFVSTFIYKLTLRILFDDWLSFFIEVKFSLDLFAFLIYEVTFVILGNDRLTVSIMLEVTTYSVRIEVMLFHIEWSWYFASLVKFSFLEHSGSVMIVDNVSGSWINDITSLICIFSIFVLELA